MKLVRELKEQYAYVWWWLLTQGLVVSTIIVNTFMLTIFGATMAVFYFVMKWLSKH